MSKNNNLKDITEIKIDPALSHEEKSALFLKEIGDPFHFLCEGIEVEIEFNESGKTLEELLKDYFRFRQE